MTNTWNDYDTLYSLRGNSDAKKWSILYNDVTDSNISFCLLLKRGCYPGHWKETHRKTGTQQKEVTKAKKKEHDWCPHTKSLQSNRGHLPFRHTKDMRTDVTSVLLQISWSCCWINVILAVERMLGLHVSIQHLDTPDFCSSMFWLSFTCLQDVIGRQWTQKSERNPQKLMCFWLLWCINSLFWMMYFSMWNVLDYGLDWTHETSQNTIKSPERQF